MTTKPLDRVYIVRDRKVCITLNELEETLRTLSEVDFVETDVIRGFSRKIYQIRVQGDDYNPFQVLNTISSSGRTIISDKPYKEGEK